MTTYRVAVRRRYTTIDQATINDERLTFFARGVLIWLLDKPDDWRCTSEEIARAGREGRDAVRRALRELEDCGYLVRERFQDPKTGRWATATMIYERPEDGIPGVGNPVVGNPVVGNPDVGEPDVGEPGAIEKTDTKELRPKTDTKELRPSSAIPASPKLRGKAKIRREKAELLVKPWWESLPTKPAQSYISIVKAIEQLEGKGWTVAEIKQALREVPTVTGPALDFWRNGRKKSATRAQGMADLEARQADDLQRAIADGKGELAWEMIREKSRVRQATRWIGRVAELIDLGHDDESIALGAKRDGRLVTVAEAAEVRSWRTDLLAGRNPMSPQLAELTA